MKHSLITVSSEWNGHVSGHWVQNHVGTIDSAREVAIRTEAANNNCIQVAVVDELSSPVPQGYWEGLKRRV